MQHGIAIQQSIMQFMGHGQHAGHFVQGFIIGQHTFIGQSAMAINQEGLVVFRIGLQKMPRVADDAARGIFSIPFSIYLIMIDRVFSFSFLIFGRAVLQHGAAS